ncbi:MAG: Transposase-like protein [Candidatus Jorgensenbacteria bacterium GW2011_GWA2_45_13]|uniref:Transposase-like protein n=1 Tax=Candidatus Jorgensenbacteria bacterium GW2011_GWA2_45_13 TaxID=1618662 RepID=A0A0G1P4G8_9BACT|nr:MAG: Transposase-like protein [Candidatus Jorgensenbacteria bacterium GW2011_GWA2_45_13]
MAFIRSKKIKGQTYYYIVENRLVGGDVRQKVLLYLGKADSLLEKLKKRGGRGAG